MNINNFLQLTKSIGQVSCAINNGGLTLEIGKDDKDQCVMRIVCTHFGHITNHIELGITNERLKTLADLFNKAAQEVFKDETYILAHDFHNPMT